MATIPKLTYRFKVIPIKISNAFFYRNGQAHPKIHMEPQVTLKSQNNLEKEQSEKTHIFYFNLPQSNNYQNNVVVT